MFKFKPLTAVLALLLIAAACTGTPPPTAESTVPPSAPSDTPIATEDGRAGYPAPGSTEAGEPVDQPTEEAGYPPAFEQPTEESGYPAPGEQPTEASESGYPAPGETEGECVVEAAEPQDHELTASDGTVLAGTFYPPAVCGAPLVVLYHQFGLDKTSWRDLALWLQNRTDESASTSGVLAAPAGQYPWFPPLPEDLSFAVFAVDFRGHGESVLVEGEPGPAGFLLDAQAAFDYAKSLPAVDPERVITIGASIGADASVDVCLNLDGSGIAADQASEGCIGALALSPGNFLEVPYVEAATRLGSPPFEMSIRCIAAEQDGNAPDLCMSDIPGNHEGTVYAGRDEHGIGLIIEGQDPDIGQLIYDFLLEALGIEG